MSQTPEVSLRVNDGVQLALMDEDGGEGEMAHTYVEALGEDSLRMPIPSRGGTLLYFSRGATIALYVTQDDAVYRAECEGLDVRRPRGIPTVRITAPQKFQRVQRRRHVRWECSLRVRWRSTSERRGGGEEGEAVTINLSCGGMLCRGGRQAPRTGERCEFTIFLREDETIECAGKVVRSRGRRKDRSAVWAVEFTQIAAADEDRIQNFIFREMLMMRRLGLM